MTRLFVAAWPSPDVRARLVALGLEASDDVRPVPSENWHVTLRFLGDTDPDAVAERLASARLPRVRLVYGPATVVFDRGQIVVPVAGAQPLAASVAAATIDLGRAPRREYVGHLTIGRRRRRRDAGADTSPAADVWLGLPIDAEQTVDAVALVSSELLPSGATYRTLGAFATTPSA